jgi:hypothetical protein
MDRLVVFLAQGPVRGSSSLMKKGGAAASTFDAIAFWISPIQISSGITNRARRFRLNFCGDDLRANMANGSNKPFQGLCEHCGATGLYAMHEGLVPTGRVIWFCAEHKPDFRKLQYEYAMAKRVRRSEG